MFHWSTSYQERDQALQYYQEMHVALEPSHLLHTKETEVANTNQSDEDTQSALDPPFQAKFYC